MLHRCKPVRGNRWGTLVCVSGKVGFRSEALALQRLYEQQEETTHATSNVRAYQCRLCPWWHLTSQPSNFAGVDKIGAEQ